MKLTVIEFVSLDGVSQGPGSPEEDTSDGFTQGGWLGPFRFRVDWIVESQ